MNWFGTTWAAALDISNAFDRVKHAGYFQKLKCYGISGQVFGLISFFWVIITDSFKWLWMVSLHKNIQLMMYFLKAPLLVLHLSYYKLMIFLMMFFVILLSMLMILLSVLNLIGHLLCGNNLNRFLNLNLIYETSWTGVRSGLLISMLGKLSWFRLTSLITMVPLTWKWMGLSWGKIIF